MQITVPTQEISDEDLQNVAITAVEGGIGYWAQCEHYHALDTTTFDGTLPPIETVTRLRIAEAKDADRARGAGFTDDYQWDKPLTLDPAKLREAMTKRAAWKGLSIRAWIDNMDATEADVVVQLATLGEIRYG